MTICGSGMTRRSLLGGATVSTVLSPDTAWAQKPALPVVGFLSLLPESTLSEQLASFQAGLEATGFVAGRNVTIAYRWADGQIDRLPALAAELVRLPANVIVAAGGNYSAEAAKAATSTIPIVFSAVSDPARAGLVASFNRPGGNVTGVSILSHELDAKRFELMNELVPAPGPIGALVNPRNPATQLQQRTLQTAAAAAGRELLLVEAGTAAEIAPALVRLADQRAIALVVGADPFFTGERARIVALAAQYALPGIYQWRQFVRDGGLASYGPDFSEAYRQSGILAGRILRGEKPADLPVQQPTKFELVINIRTARTLGLAIPPVFIARADEIVE